MGRFIIGPRFRRTGLLLLEKIACSQQPHLHSAALRDATGESAQLYRRQGDIRICVAVAERLSGLRDSVPVGASLTMQAGSAAQILMAWEDSEKIHRGLKNARFTAAHLAADRRRGWAQSVGEREAGVASVSAPVRGPNGKVIAAVCN
jgi:DNA-binding IclR family transcriptional regulator